MSDNREKEMKYYKFKPFKLDVNLTETSPIKNEPLELEECTKEEFERIKAELKRRNESFKQFIENDPLMKRIIEDL